MGMGGAGNDSSGASGSGSGSGGRGSGSSGNSGGPVPAEEAKDASFAITPERGEARSSAAVSMRNTNNANNINGDEPGDDEQNYPTNRRHSVDSPSNSVLHISKSIFSFFRRKRSLSSAGGTGAAVQPSKDTYTDPFREPLIDPSYEQVSPPSRADYPIKQLS